MKKILLPLGLCVVAIATPFDSSFAGLIGVNGDLPNVYDVNTGSGAATNPRFTGLSSSLGGIARDPVSGNIYGLTLFNGAQPNSLVTVNPITGLATVVGATGLSMIFEGDLAFNPLDGSLYGIQDVPGVGRNLFSINPGTGAASTIGSMASSGDFSALAFNSLGTLFTIDSGGVGPSHLYSVNPATAAIALIAPMSVDLGAVAALTFDPTTGTAFLADGATAGTNMLYTLNTATGVASAIGPLGISTGLSGLAFTEGSSTTVPEPATLALLGLGLAGLGFSRRKQ